MLSVRALTIRHGATEAVRRANFTLRRGETAAIVGPNGAGKTSLLMGIARLAPIFAGEIRFEDATIERLDFAELRGIAIVPETRMLAPRMTVDETLRLAGRRLASREAERCRDELLGTLPHLAALVDRRAGTLSGGEAQLLAIARALMARPCLLLVDEPALGLSAASLQTVRSVFERLKRDGLTMLIAEQAPHLSAGLADRTARMADGVLAPFEPAGHSPASREEF